MINIMIFENKILYSELDLAKNGNYLRFLENYRKIQRNVSYEMFKLQIQLFSIFQCTAVSIFWS